MKKKIVKLRKYFSKVEKENFNVSTIKTILDSNQLENAHVHPYKVTVKQGYTNGGPWDTSGLPMSSIIKRRKEYQKTSMRKTFKQFKMINILVRVAILCAHLNFQHLHTYTEEH